MSKAAIREIVRAQRESLDDVFMDVRFERTDYAPGGGVTRRAETATLASSGSKLLFKVKRPEASGNWPKQDSAVGYDGKVVRTYQAYGAGRGAGSIDAFGGRAPLTRGEVNILWWAMLIDSVYEHGVELPFYDLCHFLARDETVVLEESTELRGLKCLVVSTGGLEAALSLDRNCAVVQFAQRSPHTVPPTTQYVRDLEAFRDCGNGLWLPTRALTKSWRKDGSLEYEESLIVLELKANETLPASLFEEVIPEGVMIADGVRNLVYRSGESVSIDSMIDGALGARKAGRGTGWWLMRMVLLFGGPALALFVACWSRWRRKHAAT